MRLFVAIPLAGPVLSELSRLVAKLRSGGDNLRWMPPESWHITLQFLGSIAQEQYDCLVSQLNQVHSVPVPVRLGELGSFDRAGVFFADIVPTSELVTLAGRVTAATSHCGFVAEMRPFHPHITLARVKGQDHACSLRTLQQKIQSQPSFTRFTASEFLLYESHLSPTGSTYEIRHRFPLDRSGPQSSHSLSPGN